jgi:heme ABC exporter ATP-binding subunit CcmA
VGAEIVIEARGLTRKFGHLTALEAVDLDLRQGEALTLFGPNGAGKTTLLRILTSTLKPTSGTVRIAGRDPRVYERETRRLLGLISHQTFLYEELTARENLLFFGRLYGAADPAAAATALLDSMGLTLRQDDAVATYSRGMQQRLALARCLIHDPEVVVLDEPFTGLDPHSATMLRRTLEALRTAGRTLLMVTHNLSRGLELSDRFMILAQGRVAAEGVSAEVDAATFEQTYLESIERVVKRSRA